MRECLDEGVLQAFCDGEVSGIEAENITSHLSHCSACANAMTELLSVNELVSAALEPEFQAPVPTERLHQRLNAALATTRVVETSGRAGLAGWFASLANALALPRQPALSYAALVAIVAFAGIFGIAYWKQPAAPEESVAVERPISEENKDSKPAPSPTAPKTTSPPQSNQENTPAPVSPRKQRRPVREAVAKVQLLPGERSYLKTIAALDSTIKSVNDRPMTPALRAEYERNLALVDRALAAARSAAKKNPNDPDAAEFVFAAYQSKVDLMNTVADARVYNREQ
jgi:anti-sigma factor RsiW